MEEYFANEGERALHTLVKDSNSCYHSGLSLIENLSKVDERELRLRLLDGEEFYIKDHLITTYITVTFYKSGTMPTSNFHMTVGSAFDYRDRNRDQPHIDDILIFEVLHARRLFDDDL